jgi:hypothetical protein
MKKKFIWENFTLFHCRLSTPDLQERRVKIIQAITMKSKPKEQQTQGTTMQKRSNNKHEEE